MNSSAITVCSVVCAGCLVYLFARICRTFARGSGLRGFSKLPGPRGWPLLGYLRSIESPAWVTYRQWSDEYNSDVLGMNILSTNLVIANTLKAATELLETRSAICSDRYVCALLLLQMVGFDWNIGVARYGPYWRDARRVFSQAFHPQVVVRYRPAEVKLTHKFLRDLIDTPEDFRGHIKSFSGRQILHITYGLDIQDHDDPYIAAAERGGQIASACMIPGSYLVDLVPILKYVPEWFPGAGFKRQAREWRKEVEHTINAPFAAIKTRGDLTPDCAAKPLLDRLLDSSDDPAYAEYVLKGALATSYIVGVDTVASTLETFFLSMTLHPEVLREAQCAVDRVCAGRLPNFSDYDVLPWIHAIVKECLRWRPAIPMNFAHRLTRDDVYEGYHIPQGALVLANNWAILHDPEAYPGPEAFNPRRFLRACPGAGSGDVKLDPMVRDPALAAFGFGRRICPGRHMAYESIWLAIASVIAVFDVTKAVDAHGKVVEPSGEYTDGFLSAPKPFRCKLSPRSRAYAALVHAALE
ncbi:uncharacterized protein PHACADRAFT_142793 [Phanerochaete carnosa HHB-10118-sp]|uniref:Cytochrome P450 n=1 Tax=Phanerochaete carnosa (strain HHB-10118-sp) TaxID=650164 RepID=K5W7M6_PHACS|nr:uncharacterized protein PHACADRAFT_142793 [Phanerochaete carnosa HHB-10118-sp]EKM54974.1 hypothetical protein PHACADRAFT_142793 [Phanerochaete carnosa HHB-10118-sp]